MRREWSPSRGKSPNWWATLKFSLSSVWLKKVRNVALPSSGSRLARFFRQSSIYTHIRSKSRSEGLQQSRHSLYSCQSIMNSSINVSGNLVSLDEGSGPKGANWPQHLSMYVRATDTLMYTQPLLGTRECYERTLEMFFTLQCNCYITDLLLGSLTAAGSLAAVSMSPGSKPACWGRRQQ